MDWPAQQRCITSIAFICICASLIQSPPTTACIHTEFDYPDSAPIIGGTSWFGSCHHAVIVGSELFLADEVGIKIFDITNLNSPTVIGGVSTPGESWDLIKFGDYIYVADHYNGLVVVDISDRTAPEIVASINTPGTVLSISICENYIYLAQGSPGGLVVVDVSDPTSPQIVNINDDVTPLTCVKVFNNCAYVAGYHRFYIFDLSNASTPLLLSTYNLERQLWDLSVNDNHVIVSWREIGYGGGFYVFDITDPSVPSLLADVYVGSFLDYGVDYVGTHAFIAGGTQVLTYDLSIPTFPILTGMLNVPQGALDFVVDGETACVSGSNGMTLVNASDPESLAICSSYKGGYGSSCVATTSNTALLRAGALLVFDISDPESPEIVNIFPTSVNASAVACRNDLAFVGSDTQLLIFDMVEPEMPALLGSVDVFEIAHNLVLDGDYAYLASLYGSLQIVEVTNPDMPSFISSVDFPDGAIDVAVHGAFAYVATESGIQVCEVADPANPSIVGQQDIIGHRPVGIQYSGGYIYVAVQTHSFSGLLLVYDVTDPDSPFLVEIFQLPSVPVPFMGAPFDVIIEGEIAYVARRHGGVWIVDISNPTELGIVGWYDTPGQANTIALTPEFVVVADGDSGLQIAERQCAEISAVLDDGSPDLEVLLSAPFPNPFNPQTTITFTLERDGWATVNVFELTGRRVALLTDRTFESGTHSLIWNGRDTQGRAVPSGTYVVRLETETGVQARKVMLLR